jgi:hypothetical protein
MHHWLPIAALALLACACAEREPDRLVLGVSGDRPAAAPAAEADAEMRRFLDWKLGQICTQGYTTLKAETVSAEGEKQIVNEVAQCNGYDVDFTVDF